MPDPLLLALLVLVPRAGVGPAPPSLREDVRFANGSIELAGELILPEFGSGVPGVVVLQGSGDSDRTNSWSASMARAFSELGVAVLLTDKRGCGASGGDWTRAGFEELAGDALAGVELLRSHPDVDSERVGVLGLSQGGWVAPIAAALSNDVAFVVTASGAAVGYAEQVWVEMRNTARQAGLGDEGVAAVLELNGAATRYGLTGEWEPYAACRTRVLGTEARPVAAGFPDSPAHPTWEFVRRVGRFDPMPYWTAVSQPVLVVYGALDEQDNVPVAESVRRLEHAFAITGKRDGEVVVIPGVGHGLQTGGQLDEAFLDTLERWVMETLAP